MELTSEPSKCAEVKGRVIQISLKAYAQNTRKREKQPERDRWGKSLQCASQGLSDVQTFKTFITL